MKEQWQKFLDDNNSLWSFNIVPQLVHKLDVLVSMGDESAIQGVLGALARQGVTLDENGDLCFLGDIFSL